MLETIKKKIQTKVLKCYLYIPTDGEGVEELCEGFLAFLVSSGQRRAGRQLFLLYHLHSIFTFLMRTKSRSVHFYTLDTLT